MSEIANGAIVFHPKYGQCTIRMVMGDTVIIKTDSGLEECSISDVRLISSIWDDKEFSSLRAILRVQSGLVSSINNSWGVFSQTKIKLLPHQLWVCNRVMRKWPTRMMIADDVGLGKTIEAGIIMLAARNSGKARRILILTPASLTLQWQDRMRKMFSLNFQLFNSYEDRISSNQFDQDLLIASIATVRMDTNNKHDHLLDAEPWDLVVVDEAHHSGVSMEGQTLGYKLIDKMKKSGKVDSILFFTATPHQGKDYQFWSLMGLLDSTTFAVKNPSEKMYAALPDYMIRNSKSMVTDMEGKKLFKKLIQHPHVYNYAPEECRFYDKMTEYIENGKAYAKDLGDEEERQVTLVLIALQKIASSSVAAIRNALLNRLETLTNGGRKKRRISSGDDFASEDIETEKIATESNFVLMNDEIRHLGELVELAGRIKKESRIEEIQRIIREEYPSEPILLFTEYKATQALMVVALREEYGSFSVGFINGDNALFFNGRKENIRREDVMKAFNAGRLRFLVSTEASGEGVDLQHSCHVLIHIDLPWNPMRLHQRVGRIYRLGQEKDVDVVTVRNTYTIEANIWQKLDEKLDAINKTFGSVMDNPEDMKQLVIGVESPAFYTSLFSDALSIRRDRFDEWFDLNTKDLGSKNVLDTILAIEGNAAHFDISSLKEVPDYDIESLRPFMEASLKILGVGYEKEESGRLSLSVPESLLSSMNRVVSVLYSHRKTSLVFRRDSGGEDSICAVGNPVFNTVLQKTRDFDDNFAYIDGPCSYLIIRVFEKDTTKKALSEFTFVGYRINNGEYETVSERQLYELGVELLKKKYPVKPEVKASVDMISKEDTEILKKRALQDYRSVGIDYSYPEAEIYAYFSNKK